jgi:hypothetical protein
MQPSQELIPADQQCGARREGYRFARDSSVLLYELADSDPAPVGDDLN